MKFSILVSIFALAACIEMHLIRKRADKKRSDYLTMVMEPDNLDKGPLKPQNALDIPGGGHAYAYGQDKRTLSVTINNAGKRIVFNNAGLMAATTGSTQITIWDVASLSTGSIRSETFDAHSSRIDALDFVGDTLVSGDLSGIMKVWRVQAYNNVTYISQLGPTDGTPGIHDVKIGGGKVFDTENDGLCFVFNIATGSIENSFFITKTYTALLNESAYGPIFAVVNYGTTIFLYNFALSAVLSLGPVPASDGLVSSLAVDIAEDGDIIVAAGDNSGATFIYRNSDPVLTIAAPNPGSSTSQCFDNRRQLHSSVGSFTYIYNFGKNEIMQTLAGHTDVILDSACDKQSNLFATQSRDGTIQVWKTNRV